MKNKAVSPVEMMASVHSHSAHFLHPLPTICALRIDVRHCFFADHAVPLVSLTLIYLSCASLGAQ